MKKIIIALIVLVIIGFGTYYLVFKTSSNDTLTNTTQTYTPPTTPVSKKFTTAVPSNITINIKNFSFNPEALTIKVGTKVTWVNNDSAPHTITSDSGNLLNSETISPGQSFSFTFSNLGTTGYHCSVHPMMKGSVIVQN
ncbi:MAG: cupredoxin family copper-binding protein [Candidatus Paceibacterota bacterium]|jgi:plastocyanin